MADFFELYDVLIRGMGEATVTDTLSDSHWTGVEAGELLGIAMTTPGDTAPEMLTGPMKGMGLQALAQGVKSWNLREAGFGMAAINAFYNTPERLSGLGAAEPFDNYCTRGLELTGKRVGVVGHLNMPRSVYEQAAQVQILERSPQPGDYPDSACEWLLPRCDVVIITASTLVNKTLPRLLELSRNACTVLAGPTCPMCPALLDMGIDRLAGLVITDCAGMKEKIAGGLPGNPYPLGTPFLLTGEGL